MPLLVFFFASCTGTSLSCTGTIVPKVIFFSIFFSILLFLFLFTWEQWYGCIIWYFNCLSSRVFLHVHFFSCSNSTTDCISRLSTVIHSWGTFNLSIGFMAIPLIRVPKARIDLETLTSKWVQGMRQYESAGMQRNNGL